MQEFSPTDAAFEGFRLTREHPSVIPVWSVIQLIMGLGLYWAMISSGYLASVQGLMEVMAKGGQPDQAALNAVTGKLLGKMSYIIIPGVILDGLIRAALARMVLRPHSKSPGMPRLGLDELRVIAARVLVSLIMGAAAFAGMMLVGVVIGAGGPAGVLIGSVGIVGLMVGLIVLAVRLSLAIPAAFAGKSIGVMESWALTRGRFWPILGSYLLAGVLFLVVWIAGSIIASVIVRVMGASEPDLSSFQAYLKAPEIIAQVIGAIFSALGVLILYSPSVEIYRRLAVPDETQVF